MTFLNSNTSISLISKNLEDLFFLIHEYLFLGLLLLLILMLTNNANKAFYIKQAVLHLDFFSSELYILISNK